MHFIEKRIALQISSKTPTMIDIHCLKLRIDSAVRYSTYPSELLLTLMLLKTNFSGNILQKADRKRPCV